MGKKEKAYYLETYGCAASQSDSEIISGLLSRAGLEKAERCENAELVIINTCYVKKSTEEKIISRIEELQKRFPGKKMIIAGCIPEAVPEKLRKIAPKALLISTNRVAEIEKAARKAFSGKRLELLGRTGSEKVLLPKIRKSRFLDIVQVSSGCLGNCTYCGTKIAKGNLMSYCPEKIAEEISIAKESGCKEFWLTGQDVACYGFDIDTSLPELLKAVLEIKGKYFVRLGMMNPNHLEKIIDPLLEVCLDSRIMKFFHIPVQSGSDKVLLEMKRGYKAEDFERLVGTIKEKFPLCTIGTDIIVGYPTETEDDFEKTLELLKRTKPDWTNISRFGAREGTFAEKLKPLDAKIVKRRSEDASKMAGKIQGEQTKKWLGWQGEVLVTQKGIGKNFAHREITLDKPLEIGKFVKVKVERVEGTKIFGRILKIL